MSSSIRALSWFFGDPVQGAKVGDVLAGAQTSIEPGVVRQHANLFANRHGRGTDFIIVDVSRSAVGRKHRRQDPQ